MEVFTYSEARQKLATLLKKAETSGKVLIQRRDGTTFALIPEQMSGSPLDVPSIKVDISTEELVSIIREGRERGPSGEEE